MSRIGERLSTTDPHYIKHPAAGGSWVGDARPMDAAAAMTLDNNLSHLSAESLRHWAWALGPGDQTWVGNGTTTPDGFGFDQRAYDDVEPKASTFGIGDKAADLIAWDHRTAMVFGPFPLIQDRPLARGGYGPRKIRIDVQAYVDTGAQLNIIAALTPSAEPPDKGVLVIGTAAGDIAHVNTAPAGTSFHTIHLECPDTVPTNSVWRARRDGSHGPASIELPLGWLWVGWRRGTGDAAIISVSAFETR